MYMRGKGHILIPSTLLGTVYLPQYKGVEKHLNILSKNKVTTWENGKIEEVQYSQWGSLKISSNSNYHTSNTCGNLAGVSTALGLNLPSGKHRGLGAALLSRARALVQKEELKEACASVIYLQEEKNLPCSKDQVLMNHVTTLHKTIFT